MIFPALIFWSQIAYVDTCKHTHTRTHARTHAYTHVVKEDVLKYPVRSGCKLVISTDIGVKLEAKHVIQSD